jgi:hypothetical protein
MPVLRDPDRERLIEALRAFLRAHRQLLHETGREPAVEDLAGRLALPLDRATLLCRLMTEPIRIGTDGPDAIPSPARVPPRRPGSRIRAAKKRVVLPTIRSRQPIPIRKPLPAALPDR